MTWAGSIATDADKYTARETGRRATRTNRFVRPRWGPSCMTARLCQSIDARVLVGVEVRSVRALRTYDTYTQLGADDFLLTRMGFDRGRQAMAHCNHRPSGIRVTMGYKFGTLRWQSWMDTPGIDGDSERHKVIDVQPWGRDGSLGATQHDLWTRGHTVDA